jgi:hypothetical protein
MLGPEKLTSHLGPHPSPICSRQPRAHGQAGWSTCTILAIRWPTRSARSESMANMGRLLDEDY